MSNGVELASSTVVVENLHGYFRTQCTRIALELGVFDALEGGVKLTSEQIANKLNLKADRLERFLRALVCIGLLQMDGKVFSNTPASELYLVKSSPRCIVATAKLHMYTEAAFSELVCNALKGKTKKDAQGSDYYATTQVQFDAFSEAMQSNSRTDMDCLRLVDFTGCKTVIDLGGSTGYQARELRRLHPHVDHVIVAELAPVIKMAAAMPENQAAGIEFVQIDYNSDVLPPADAYILGHVIHNHTEGDETSLLKKVHRALRPGGLLVLLESVLKPDKAGPMLTMHLDLIMMMNFAGKERTADEYKTLLESEGFCDFQFEPVEGSYTFDVITARKA